MPLVYRSTKGAPLTADEIDGNFKELDQRLQHLQENPECGEGLGKIDVLDDHLRFSGTFGTDFGTFPLPKPKLNLCGHWRAHTPYQALDLITYERGLYGCEKPHTSTTWEKDVNYWKELLSLPPPSSSSLPLYEQATLPPQESLGTLALLMGHEDPTLIFFNGKTWQRLMKGAPL